MTKYTFNDWRYVEAGYGKITEGFGPANCSPYGIKIKYHSATLEKSPVLTADKPWESYRIGFTCFVKDGSKIKCWYDCVDYPAMNNFLCYAESEDGIHFIKPELDIYEYNGSKKNNIIMTHGGGPCMLIDNNCDPSEKYKLASCFYDSTGKDTKCKTILYTSADGVHFDKTHVLIEGAADSQCTIYYDEAKKKYVFYGRKQESVDSSKRRNISITDADNIYKLPPVKMLISTYAYESPDTDYYSPSFTKFEDTGLFAMTIPVYYHTSDEVRIRLFVSPDGENWYYPSTKDFINTKGYKQCYTSPGIMSYEKEKHTGYITCMRSSHNALPKENAKLYPCDGNVKRFHIREDGFSSIVSEKEGMFYTTEFRSNGNNSLKLNAKIKKDGYIKVTVTNNDNTQDILTDSSLTLCENSKIWYDVSWKNKLSEAVKDGEVFRLRFDMKNAEIFSIKL